MLDHLFKRWSSLDGTLDEILVRIYNIIGEQIKILIKEEIEPKTKGESYSF